MINFNKDVNSLENGQTNLVTREMLYALGETRDFECIEHSTCWPRGRQAVKWQCWWSLTPSTQWPSFSILWIISQKFPMTFINSWGWSSKESNQSKPNLWKMSTPKLLANCHTIIKCFNHIVSKREYSFQYVMSYLYNIPNHYIDATFDHVNMMSISFFVHSRQN